MNEGRLQPIRGRLEHLDVLRGFALLGILLVNFQYFTRPMQAIVFGSEPGLAGLDLAAEFLVRVLAESKFYPLFSMLFGAGFALMLERAAARQAPFWGIYLRRLLVLLLFGLGHMLLIWSGDILLVYSLSAFVMVLLFRKTPMKRLWKWAIVFWALPVAMMWLGTVSIEASRMDPEAHGELTAQFEADRAEMEQSTAQAAQVHAEGSYADNVLQRTRDMNFMFTYAIFWMPPILGFFLLGRWLIASGRLSRPNIHLMWFRRWRSRGLIVGLPLAGMAAWALHGQDMMVPTLRTATGMTVGIVASVLVSLGYVSVVTLGSRTLSFLAPAGRMALTNYLLQSLVWTWVFYGYGLGLWGQVPRAAHVLLAVAFFAVQVVASRLWLDHFRFGPAEWLWRSLTYWQLQPMRRT